MELILSKGTLAIPYVRQTFGSEGNTRLQGVSRLTPTLRSKCKQTSKLGWIWVDQGVLLLFLNSALLKE